MIITGENHGFSRWGESRVANIQNISISSRILAHLSEAGGLVIVWEVPRQGPECRQKYTSSGHRQTRGQNKSGRGVCKTLRIPRIHSWEYVK